MRIARHWLLLLFLGSTGCSVTLNAEFERHLQTVRSIATPGRKIDAVREDIRSRGYDTGGPFDSNKFKEGKFLEVRWGAHVGFVDSVRYSAELPTSGVPTSILVEADQDGTVTGVR